MADTTTALTAEQEAALAVGAQEQAAIDAALDTVMDFINSDRAFYFTPLAQVVDATIALVKADAA